MTDGIDDQPAGDEELSAIAAAAAPDVRARILELAEIVDTDGTESARELRRSLYDAGLVTNRFDWVEWSRDSRYRTGDHLDEASPADAVRLITRFVRGDRFSEGLLDHVIRDGSFATVVRRALG